MKLISCFYSFIISFCLFSWYTLLSILKVRTYYFSLNIFYIIDVYKNPAIREDMRIVWLLIVFFAGIIGMAIYYFIYIIGDPPAVRKVN